MSPEKQQNRRKKCENTSIFIVSNLKFFFQPEEPLDPSVTLDATMIENNPEIRKMFLDAAIKQESALVLKYKYDSRFLF